jgi:hypothetical protein
MALATLSIDLEARLSKLQTSLDKAGRIAEKDSARMTKAFDKARVAAAGIGAALVAGLSAGAVTRFVRGSIDSADAAIKQARAVGVLTEEITALNYAAELSGVSQEQLNTGLGRLARNAKDASEGARQSVNAFGQLGVSVTGADGQLKSTSALLGEIADKFQAMPEGIRKTAAAQELFGRSGAQLISLLNGGSAGLEAFRREAERLGIVLDTETAEAAERVNDNFTRLGKLAEGVANRLARPLLPLLEDLTGLFLDLSTSSDKAADGLGNASVLASGLKVVFEALLVTGANVSFVLAAVGREIGAIAAQTVALARLDINAFRAISAAVKEDAERARAELDAFEARVFALGARDGAASRPPARRGGEPPDVEPAGRRSTGKPAQAGGGLIADSLLVYQAEQLRTAFEAIDRVNQAAQGASLSADSVLVYQADQLREAFELIDEVNAKALTENVQEVFDAMDDRTKQFLANVQDAFGETLLATFKGSTDGILEQWKNLLLRMVAEAAAADLVGALSGRGGGNLASLGGSLASLLGGLFGGGRAIGGPARRGQIVEVNEIGGPGELFTAGGRQYLLPSADGVVTPAVQRAAAPSAGGGGRGAGGVVSIALSPQIYIDARTDQAQVAQMVAAGMAQAQRSMWQQMRARGLA